MIELRRTKSKICMSLFTGRIFILSLQSGKEVIACFTSQKDVLHANVFREKALLEDRMKTREDLVKKREDNVRRLEIEYEQRLRDEVTK